MPATPAQASDSDAVGPLKKPAVWALVTSRCRLEVDEPNPEQMKAGILGHQRQLGTLAMASAVELLQAHVGGVAVNTDQAKQLADTCACNALALTIVGGFIASKRVTPDVRCFPIPCSRAVLRGQTSQPVMLFCQTQHHLAVHRSHVCMMIRPSSGSGAVEGLVCLYRMQWHTHARQGCLP